MFVFRQNLSRAIASSKYAKSVSRLSADAALGEKTLGNMLNNPAVDIAKAGPGIFGIKRVADLLGVSLDYLVGKNADDRPNPTLFMERYKATGGQIEGFTDLLPLADLYYAAKTGDTRLRLCAQGNNSLSAQVMPSPSTQHLQAVLDDLEGTKILENSISDHLVCQRKGCIATLEELNDPMPSEPVQVKLDYIRVLARLADKAGKSYVLNYSFRV